MIRAIICLVCLTVGPAFLSAGIYLCLARIVVVFGTSNSHFRLAIYTIKSLCCDFVSLLLQAAAGAIASGAQIQIQNQMGIDIQLRVVDAGGVSDAVHGAVRKLCGDRIRRFRRVIRSIVRLGGRGSPRHFCLMNFVS